MRCSERLGRSRPPWTAPNRLAPPCLGDEVQVHWPGVATALRVRSIRTSTSLLQVPRVACPPGQLPVRMAYPTLTGLEGGGRDRDGDRPHSQYSWAPVNTGAHRCSPCRCQARTSQALVVSRARETTLGGRHAFRKVWLLLHRCLGSAVDRDRLPGDRLGTVRGEEQRQCGNVVGVDEAFDGLQT